MEKFVHDSDEVCQLLCDIAKHTEENGGKLIPANQAKTKAKKATKATNTVVEASDIKFSVPWYLKIAQMYLAQGIKLPPYTQVSLYKKGEPIQFNPTGLQRGVRVAKDGSKVVVHHKPVLQTKFVLPLLKANPRLTKTNARALANEINDEYYGPSEEQLREILYSDSNKSIITTAQKEQQLPAVLAKAGDGKTKNGMTKTQTAVLFGNYIASTNACVEAIANSTEVKKEALKHNEKITDALIEMGKHNNKVISESEEDTSKIQGMMLMQTKMAAQVFGIGEDDGQNEGIESLQTFPKVPDLAPMPKAPAVPADSITERPKTKVALLEQASTGPDDEVAAAPMKKKSSPRTSLASKFWSASPPKEEIASRSSPKMGTDEPATPMSTPISNRSKSLFHQTPRRSSRKKNVVKELYKPVAKPAGL